MKMILSARINLKKSTSGFRSGLAMSEEKGEEG
jgi:hypothetical protein